MQNLPLSFDLDWMVERDLALPLDFQVFRFLFELVRQEFVFSHRLVYLRIVPMYQALPD